MYPQIDGVVCSSACCVYKPRCDPYKIENLCFAQFSSQRILFLLWLVLDANVASRKHLTKESQKFKTNVVNISKTPAKLLKLKHVKRTKKSNISRDKCFEHPEVCNNRISYVYFMINLTLHSAVTHRNNIDLTRIVCVYKLHNQYSNVNVWNIQKEDT